MTLLANVPSSGSLYFWFPILADKLVPELVVCIPFGDVSVISGRFVAAQGFEWSLGELVEVNVRASLLQPRAGLQDLQPRQFVGGEFGEPVVQHFVIGGWEALGGVAAGRRRLAGCQLFTE